VLLFCFIVLLYLKGGLNLHSHHKHPSPLPSLIIVLSIHTTLLLLFVLLFCFIILLYLKGCLNLNPHQKRPYPLHSPTSSSFHPYALLCCCCLCCCFVLSFFFISWDVSTSTRINNVLPHSPTSSSAYPYALLCCWLFVSLLSFFLFITWARACLEGVMLLGRQNKALLILLELWLMH